MWLGGRLRTAALAAACVALTLLAAVRPAAQSGRVDCGNGSYCPTGNACLVGGMCGKMVDVTPGSVRTSKGTYCDPGFRESKHVAGNCIPGSYTECGDGTACPTGSTCGATGCEGGPPQTGPVCGPARCVEGRICASNGKCMNTEFFQDCGNGTICSRSAACEYPKGCVSVSAKRTRQIPLSR
jgi:hypothetical protein